MPFRHLSTSKYIIFQFTLIFRACQGISLIHFLFYSVLYLLLAYRLVQIAPQVAFWLLNFEIFFLLDIITMMCNTKFKINSKGARKSLIGNPVRIGDGPAAVIGDEHCMMPLAERPGRRSR